MAKDIRISTDLFDHPKIIALQREAGQTAVLHLIKLWAYCGKFHTNGILENMSENDIEKAIHWTGKKGHFISSIISQKFLKKNQKFFMINDWKNHNPYVFSEEKRIKSAKKAVNTRWQRYKKQQLKPPKNTDTESIRKLYGSYKIRNTDSIRSRYGIDTPNTPYPYPNPDINIYNISSNHDILSTWKEITGSDLTDDDLNKILSYDFDSIGLAFSKMKKYRAKKINYLLKILESQKEEKTVKAEDGPIIEDEAVKKFISYAETMPSDMKIELILKSYKSRYQPIVEKYLKDHNLIHLSGQELKNSF